MVVALVAAVGVVSLGFMLVGRKKKPTSSLVRLAGGPHSLAPTIDQWMEQAADGETGNHPGEPGESFSGEQGPAGLEDGLDNGKSSPDSTGPGSSGPDSPNP